MKAQYDKVFAAHVLAKVEKAKALGIKASWTTANHLDALAACITERPEAVRDILGECYNVSAFQQMLAKKFAAVGHFQREKDRPVSEKADDVYAQLAAQVASEAKQPAQG